MTKTWEIATALTHQKAWPVKASSLCSRVALNISKCAKGFGLGVASNLIVVPASEGIVFLSEKLGFIDNWSRPNIVEILSLGNTRIAKLAGRRFFNVKAINTATCQIEEYVKQWNRISPRFPTTVFGVKAKLFRTAGVIGPILEEIAFRSLLQDVLLGRIPKYIVSKIAPGKETLLDTNIAKAFRVTLVAAAFAAVHLANSEMLPDSFFKARVISTFVTGIAHGVLKEAEAGLLGSIGGHIANSILSMLPELWDC